MHNNTNLNKTQRNTTNSNPRKTEQRQTTQIKSPQSRIITQRKGKGTQINATSTPAQCKTQQKQIDATQSNAKHNITTPIQSQQSKSEFNRAKQSKAHDDKAKQGKAK